MELTDIKHIQQVELSEFEPDILIAASGYESRSICIPENFCEENIQKVVLSFKEGARELARPGNDQFYEKAGFEKYITSGSGEPDFETIFSKLNNKKEIKVLIDISVMTRIWYHTFLKFLIKNEAYDTMIVRVTYCAAVFNDPMSIKKRINMVSFLEEKENISNYSNDKKTALILGLGVEKGLSSQIFESLLPDKTFLLYADSSVQKGYVENVFINNHDVITNNDIKNLKGYDLKDTKSIYDLLLDIALPLRKDYRLIIVPQGPKIFSLVSMIFQMGYPDIDLQYPMYKIRKIKDRVSSGSYTAIDLTFEKE